MMTMLTISTALAQGGHPRPDFERTEWINLNGLWEFQFDPNNRGLAENWQTLEKPYALTIRVPYGWESKLSGVERKDYKGVAWYRREFSLPENWNGKRVWLCFGAVDHKAEVWVNGQSVGTHEGGYSEFRFDITPYVRFGRPNTLVVRVEDFTDPETPLGKQIPSWYTSTSGIWQTVWLEATGEAWIEGCRIIPQADSSGGSSPSIPARRRAPRGLRDRPWLPPTAARAALTATEAGRGQRGCPKLFRVSWVTSFRMLTGKRSSGVLLRLLPPQSGKCGGDSGEPGWQIVVNPAPFLLAQETARRQGRGL